MKQAKPWPRLNDTILASTKQETGRRIHPFLGCCLSHMNTSACRRVLWGRLFFCALRPSRESINAARGHLQMSSPIQELHRQSGRPGVGALNPPAKSDYRVHVARDTCPQFDKLLECTMSPPPFRFCHPPPPNFQHFSREDPSLVSASSGGAAKAKRHLSAALRRLGSQGQLLSPSPSSPLRSLPTGDRDRLEPSSWYHQYVLYLLHERGFR